MSVTQRCADAYNEAMALEIGRTEVEKGKRA